MSWKNYLANTQETKYNITHLDAVKDLNNNCVLDYVLRCLEIAEKETQTANMQVRKLALRTIQWMDVAKCGSTIDRARWKALCPSICLDVHTEASAAIYLAEAPSEDDEWTKKVVAALIQTHGLVGQYIMGECSLSAFDVFKEIDIPKPILFRTLKIITHAVMAGVSESLWKEHQVKVNALLTNIVNGIYKTETAEVRLKKLFPAFKYAELTEDEQELYTSIFNQASIWYPTASLEDFNRTELNTIFSFVKSHMAPEITHIDFYNLLREFSYDKNDTRTTNVYKKRILEVLLREMSEETAGIAEKEHVSINCVKDANCLKFVVQFTPVCEALINFCVEAERSNFATYQKNILTIFDMFGFRRDVFDRLSNERDYLDTMNNAKASTKLSILDYIQGETIVDVGSGGGVLLDEIAAKYPDKKVSGTDISQSVIEHLNKKIQNEHRTYNVFEHNFVHQRLWTPVDNIIFSSIMHEIYSYTELNRRKFNMDSVACALFNAYHSLNQGGRVIIRDGVKTESSRTVSVKFKEEDAFRLAKNFLKDFQGLPELRNENGQLTNVTVYQDTITADINIIREMLYTITWGPMSYPQEVQEQFGYLTLNEYVDLLKTTGFMVRTAEQLIEPGYEEHLSDKVDLLDFTWNDIPTTCIIVAEK